MGVLTEYFVATPAEAAACTVVGPAAGIGLVVRLKGVEPAVLLGQLWAAINRTNYSMEYDTTDELIAGDDDGPWTVAIKPAFITALASVTDEAAPGLAAIWSAAEEWWGSGDPVLLTETIIQLRDLAAACTNETHLFVWLAV